MECQGASYEGATRTATVLYSRYSSLIFKGIGKALTLTNEVSHNGDTAWASPVQAGT
jgi:hypothetical protein